MLGEGLRRRETPSSIRGTSLVAALSEIASRVQRGRTTDAVLQIAGEGTLALGMRLGAFQVTASALVLRYIATPPQRLAEIERRIGRPLRGLSAPLADWELLREAVEGGRTLYREDLDLFDRFLRQATDQDTTALDARPDTARIKNGVLAPIFVREKSWGLLAVFSHVLTREDADAVALFALQVGSAIELAEFIEALERSNQELCRTQRELVKRERLAALGELAAVVAHEVRNPLGVLFNSIGSLRKTLRSGGASSDPVDVDLLLSIAGEEADRLNRFVSDLLDFARPHEPQISRAGLPEVIADVVAAADACARVRLDVAADLPLVEMDPQFIRRALLNLVLNGLQAMPKGGTLVVSARAEARDGRALVRVDVTDQGTGISADAQARIFDPFFTTKATGTGLGLAVVKRIMDSHRGDVAVDSGPGGTTFTLSWPVGPP